MVVIGIFTIFYFCISFKANLNKLILNIFKFILDYNNFKYIEKRAFEIFFKNNNTMDINYNPLNCSNFNEFLWILQQRDQLRERLSAQCSDQTDLWQLGLNYFKFFQYLWHFTVGANFSNLTRKLCEVLRF